MKISDTAKVILGVAILTMSGALQAQETPDDAAVWAVVEKQWQATEKGDTKWVEELLAESFTGWANSTPAPRTKSSIDMWQKFDSNQWDGMTHELYPLAIVVVGDTAVAHYLYSNAGENSEGKTEVVHGRYTDVLVRIEGEWKFLAWHGGSDGE